MSHKLISPRVLYTSITNRVLSWFDRFTAYYNCMSKNVTKLISPRVLCTSMTNRVLSWFDRFKAYFYCMSKNVTKLISPPVLCTSITNRVPSWFDCFAAYYNCMSKSVTKPISPRVLCTSVTNRVPSWFDRFTAYYYCMSKNVTKLISPRVLCTSITNRVLADLTVLRLITTVWAKMSQTHISASSVHKYHKSCSKLIWPFCGLLQLYEQKCHKTHISSEFCAQVSQIVFLADLTVLRLITIVWAKMSQNS